MGDLTKHFSTWEFTCRCGCRLCMLDPELVDALEQLRVLSDGPLHVMSGTRCSRHNAVVGGHRASLHQPKWKRRGDGEIIYGHCRETDPVELVRPTRAADLVSSRVDLKRLAGIAEGAVKWFGHVYVGDGFVHVAKCRPIEDTDDS